MDIRFKEDKSDPIAFVFSYPEIEVVCINPLASWSEVMCVAPVYDRYKAVSMSVEDFMINALGWEALMLAIFRGQGIRFSLSLDAVCGTSKGFHDMFLDIHHYRS